LQRYGVERIAVGSARVLEPEDIVTERDFFVCIQQLADKARAYQGTLADYLSGVLRLVSDHEHDAPTGRLIARILTDGLTREPMSFDPAWLAYIDPPTAVTSGDWGGVDPLSVLQDMLRYQIADLHRMSASGALQDPYRHLGLVSPTGRSWYNFDPATFLLCAISPFAETEDGDKESGSSEESWADLATLLWLGQIYE
jgi:hypothetical protein